MQPRPKVAGFRPPDDQRAMIELFQAREGFSSINRASIALVDRALVAYFAEQDERYQAEEICASCRAQLRIHYTPAPRQR